MSLLNKATEGVSKLVENISTVMSDVQDGVHKFVNDTYKLPGSNNPNVQLGQKSGFEESEKDFNAMAPRAERMKTNDELRTEAKEVLQERGLALDQMRGNLDSVVEGAINR